MSIPINTTNGRTIDLADYVLNGNASFSPSRIVTLNVSTVNIPLKVKIAVLYGNETLSACTFLIYTNAEVCLKDTLAHVSNAVQQCVNTGENMSCAYTCNNGFVFYGGNFTQKVNCSGMNVWKPSLYPESCLKYELPAFVVKFDVTYSLDTLATICIKNFDALLKDANTTISSNIVSYCRFLDPGEFIIDSISSSSLTFKITTTFQGHFVGVKPDKSRETCIQFLEGSFSRSFVLPASSVQCSDNTQAMVTVYSMGNTEIGNKCNEKLLLSYEFGDICVPCPAGRYFSTHTCNICSEGLYQDLPDQSVCKNCGTNAISRSDRTSCISRCPPGFTSTDGFTDCKPCERDRFWINATLCEKCPEGYGTVENGVLHKSGCKTVCQTGRYSQTGYTPCKICPLHHYQNLEGQTSCKECNYNQRTYKTGSINSSECIIADIPNCDRTVLTGCENGNTTFQNHSAFCVCFEDQRGSRTNDRQGQMDTTKLQTKFKAANGGQKSWEH
uniref:Uncharacterized protein LOC111111552 n=1 Tax=Crassostrea virginica TaxID=6565 RepID=A0A8B8BN17_CRAVI|nr:uncharacterized protein LOC111111552 [Crassostrea virginica]